MGASKRLYNQKYEEMEYNIPPSDTEYFEFIPGCNPPCVVSTHGRVLNAVTGVHRKTRFCAKGYIKTQLYINKKHTDARVHRLVAEAFIPNPKNKPQVNHKDGDKTNNHVLNLEWVTNLENMRHAIENGLVPRPKKGTLNTCSKLTLENVKEIRTSNKSLKQLADKFGVAKSTIANCKNHKTYKND